MLRNYVIIHVFIEAGCCIKLANGKEVHNYCARTRENCACAPKDRLVLAKVSISKEERTKQ